MLSFWEQTNVLGPSYRLVGEGFNDGDIAVKMNLNRSESRRLYSLDRTFPGV
jgi:hypothetical protein